MGRKRKIPIANEEKENEGEEERNVGTHESSASYMDNGLIFTIMSKIQVNETYHKKYIRELRQLYEKMDHNTFLFTFIKMIKSAMAAEENNEFAHTTLLFCAKFVSSFEGEETHPLLADTCQWLLSTISNNQHIRFRLCQFVNMILNALGQEATLDDVICDNIMEYMVGRLVDVAPSVRVQAILAMQRLQVPDNPDDPVLRSYQYHLCSDPSPRVRQTVITCMGRNYHTIPYILDRLWDIDEKVRRHTYLHMSSYPVRSYKVSQRLTLLEQGLNDRSEAVRKVVTNIMLQQWIESYQKDLVGLVSALKLDSNEADLNRFRKIGKQALREIFKRQSNEDIVACLSLETEGEFYRCVPHEKLTIETSFYWQCLTEYLQSEMAEELDFVVPELSVFCSYVEAFCRSCKREMDKFEVMEFQYVLLSLMEIVYTFDLGDEIGRGNLQKLLEELLRNVNLDERVIEVVVKCVENLMPDQTSRHQFFLDIISDMCGLNAKQQDLVHDRNLISELLANSSDSDLNLKLSALKVKILDLEEQEMDYVRVKDYVSAQQIIEVKNQATYEFTNLLRPLLEKRNAASGDAVQPQFSRVVKHECILRSLQITFYMVVSKRVKTLGHASCRLYNDFIFRNIASNQIAIRDWALKCGAAFSMLYEPLAKDVFEELYAQFFKNHNIRIWETAITCIFELLDRYGVDSFVVQEDQNKAKKTGRQLYNTLEFIDAEDDTAQSAVLGQGVGVIYMMSHFLDTCDDMCIVRAIINGFCRLLLHGHSDNRDIVEKLLLRYFNPATEPEINQILSVFLENLMRNRKQHLLLPCLMTTVNSVMTAPYDSPLHDIRPETITHFIIDSTRPEALAGTTKEHSHNKLALIFLNEMVNNPNNKDLCKLLAKELISLDVNVGSNRELKAEMKELADKIIQNKFDPKTVKNVIDFKDMLDGVFNPPLKGANDESEDDDETTEATASQIVNNGGGSDTISNSGANSAAQDSEATLTEATINSVPPQSNPLESPAVLNITTTFGSTNRTTHNLLRRRSNASRNNSIDSTSTTGPAEETRRSMIRIEARIDSDTKNKESLDKNDSSDSSARRSLRFTGEEDATVVAREPEIIEMILVSPSKTPSKVVTVDEAVDGSSTATTMVTAVLSSQKDNSGRSESTSSKDGVGARAKSSREMRPRSARRNKASDAHSEESDTAEAISASPTATSVRSMRSRTLREVSLRDGKTSDITPLRNGRKRALLISPDRNSVASMASPARKQPCIDIEPEVSAKSNAPNTRRRSNLTLDPETRRESLAPVPREIQMLQYGSQSVSKDNESTTSAVESGTSSPHKSAEGTRRSIRGLSALTGDFESPKVVSTSVTHVVERITRNSAKKDKVSKEEVAKNTLTQSAAAQQKGNSHKSRIPVRRQQEKEVPQLQARKTSPRVLAVRQAAARSKRLNMAAAAASRLPLRQTRKQQT